MGAIGLEPTKTEVGEFTVPCNYYVGKQAIYLTLFYSVANQEIIEDRKPNLGGAFRLLLLDNLESQFKVSRAVK